MQELTEQQEQEALAARLVDGISYEPVEPEPKTTAKKRTSRQPPLLPLPVPLTEET